MTDRVPATFRRGSGALSTSTWPVAVVVIIAFGTVLRAVSLALSWNRPLDPDASEYLLLARRYSFAHPWSASFREPLWRAIVKIATGPWGYSAHSLRIFTTAISVATLPIAWILFRRIAVSRSVSLRAMWIALAILALSAQVNREASRGLREDLCLLLFLVFAAALLTRPMTFRAAATLAVTIGLLSVIRWELASFGLVVATLFAIFRRIGWQAPVLALVAIVVFSGPWLYANRQAHGKLFYNTDVHATYYWKNDQTNAVRARFYSPPAADPPIHLSWSDYYLHYLGPLESARRVVIGYPKLAVKLLASQVVPRGAATAALGGSQHNKSWRLTVYALGALFVLLLALAAIRLRKTGRVASLTWESAAILALAIAPYAVIANAVEMRVLLFAVPMFALSTGIVVDRLIASVEISKKRVGEAPV